MYINKKEQHVKCVIVLAKICEHGSYASHVAGIFSHSLALFAFLYCTC